MQKQTVVEMLTDRLSLERARADRYQEECVALRKEIDTLKSKDGRKSFFERRDQLIEERTSKTTVSDDPGPICLGLKPDEVLVEYILTIRILMEAEQWKVLNEMCYEHRTREIDDLLKTVALLRTTYSVRHKLPDWMNLLGRTNKFIEYHDLNPEILQGLTK